MPANQGQQCPHARMFSCGMIVSLISKQLGTPRGCDRISCVFTTHLIFVFFPGDRSSQPDRPSNILVMPNKSFFEMIFTVGPARLAVMFENFRQICHLSTLDRFILIR